MRAHRPSRTQAPLALPRKHDFERSFHRFQQAQPKAAETRARKRAAEWERRWELHRQYLKLSRRQALLLRACDGKSPSLREAIEVVYAVRWTRLGKRRRPQYIRRLRTLQHAVNAKLRVKYDRQRISVMSGKLKLVSAGEWKRLVHRSPLLGSGPESRGPSAVTQCADLILALFEKSSPHDGRLATKALEEACRLAGFPSGTIRRARKQLGLQSELVGFGAMGSWFLSLPVLQKEAKI